MIRACIFDLGGTIIDRYSKTTFSALHQAFSKYKLPIRDSLIYNDMGLEKIEHIHKILFDPHISRSFMQQYGEYPDTDDTYMIFNVFNRIQKESLKEIDIIPETKDVIDHLREKNILIGVTTGFDKEITDIIANQLTENDIKIDKYISSSCLDAPSRPYPHMINHIMTEFKIDNPYSVMKIDDTFIGIEEGKSASTWTTGVARWSTNMRIKTNEEYNDLSIFERDKKLNECRDILSSANPNYVIDTLDELPDIIRNLGFRIVW
jgi:phosphonoacetaldehyde hydrolase